LEPIRQFGTPFGHRVVLDSVSTAWLVPDPTTKARIIIHLLIAIAFYLLEFLARHYSIRVRVHAKLSHTFHTSP
jgi:hypothetical protein